MLAGFAQAGVRVGTDFRLVGFDDIEECALTWPQLSSVRCDVARFGRESAEAMLAWLEMGAPAGDPSRASRADRARVERRSAGMSTRTPGGPGATAAVDIQVG